MAAPPPAGYPAQTLETRGPTIHSVRRHAILPPGGGQFSMSLDTASQSTPLRFASSIRSLLFLAEQAPLR